MGLFDNKEGNGNYLELAHKYRFNILQTRIELETIYLQHQTSKTVGLTVGLCVSYSRADTQSTITEN